MTNVKSLKDINYSRVCLSDNCTMMKKLTKVFLLLLCLMGTTLQAYAAPRIKRDGDFKDLVTQSTVFADKSLFIKDVIEDADTTLLLAMPRRWGKTVNLDMLKRFLEIPVDDNGEILDEPNKIKAVNYQIFRRECVSQPGSSKSLLSISCSTIRIQDPEDLFVQKEVDALELQGTYPVIYIDFKSCKGANYDEVLAGIQRVLRDCFTKHGYLANSAKLGITQKALANKYLEAISPILLNTDEIKSGLHFLSDALYAHYGKKVWILVDEYDAVANVAYREFSEGDCEKTISLFQGIYEAAFKGNNYLEKGVLTGVQYIAQSGMLSGLNNLGKVDFTNANYAQHYGLNQEEVDHFFTHFKVPSDLSDKAKQWYDGYRVPKYDQSKSTTQKLGVLEKYNVWSIVSYLKEGEFDKFKSHWEKSGSIDFLGELFKAKNVREKIEQLVNGESIYLERIADFSAHDFKTLKEMLGGNKEVNNNGLKVLLSYLFIGGYLTIDGSTPNHYRIPNMEITYEMGGRLITYYETTCTIDPEKIQRVTDVLQRVMDIDESRQSGLSALLKDFYSNFQEVIRSIRLVDQKNEEGVFTNEDIVHSILNYIALQTQHATMGSELYTTKLSTEAKGRADLKITKGDIGMIIEVKCVPAQEGATHMQEALTQAKDYSNLLNTNNKLFLAINVAKQESKPNERNIELLCATGVAEDADTIKVNSKGQLVESNKRRRVA